MKTAQEAKQLTDSMIKVSMNRTLRKISACIDKAISEGKYSINVCESLNSEVIKVLNENGYSVKGFYDQREGDTVTISWANS